MNKLDRDGREPLDLLQELEEVLGIAGYPMNWPIGMGKAFEGLYDLYNQRLELYKGMSVLPVWKMGTSSWQQPIL